MTENPKQASGDLKPPLHLLPPAGMVLESLVLGCGAAEYGPWNWRDTNIRLMTYVGAIRRHLLAIVDGETDDPKTGLPHIAHIKASCGIVLDAMLSGKLIDDRPPPGPGPALLELYTKKPPTHAGGLGSGPQDDSQSH